MPLWMYRGPRKFSHGMWLSEGRIIENPKKPSNEFILVDIEGEQIEEPQNLNFDIDGDGKIDNKDISLMAKKLGKRGGRPSKKTKKGDKK